MPLQNDISNFITRSQDPVRVPDPPTRLLIELYANGLLGRYRETELALFQINQLGYVFPKPADATGFSDKERIHFYSDGYWVFTRSIFDILAQVINQTHNLGIPEQNCDFSTLLRTINGTRPGDPLTNILNGISGSPQFIALNAYRNCSLHRRQVYLEGRKTEKDYGTPGYSTGLFTSYDWLLCDDPLLVTPTLANNYLVAQYCTTIFQFIESQISSIINVLIP